MSVETPSLSSLPSGHEVLVVDDELRIRNMLNQALNEMGFRATLASSAEAAAKVLASQVFDILILDLNLPGMDGMQFLETVRKRQPDIAVIILTGFGDLDAAKRAIHLDVVDFLTKPCALGNLELALARASKRRKGHIVEGAAVTNEPAHQFASESQQPAASPCAESQSLEDLEQRHILEVLKRQNGNRAATAQELGISLRKLYYRLGEYQRKGLIS